MHFRYEKVRTITNLLEPQRIRHTAPVENVRFLPCGYKHGNDLPDPATMRPFTVGNRFGEGNDSHAWFYLHVTRPAVMAGEEMYLRVGTEFNGWDADKPQFIAYVDGVMRQGLDINHTDLLLEGKDEFDVWLYAYTGQLIPSAEFRASLISIDRDVEKLYYDLLFPRQVMEFLSQDSVEYATILKHLDHAVDLLDLREVPSENFYRSVREADAYLATAFYEGYCHPQEATVVSIGHTHIDCAWLWTLDQTREKVQRSFATVIELMKRYPEYKFMSSQALLYKDAKEEAPELYEEIKKMVAAGRWEVEGAMWVEADCNLSGGESLVRQVMYGKRFFHDEFGVDSHVLWLPDVFGYSAAMPQILRKCGVDWFVTSKISWNEYDKMPYDTFFWRGIDGTEIRSYFITAQDKRRGAAPVRYSTYVGNTKAPMIAGTYERYQQKDLSHEAILTYGYGDGGGGPTKEQIELLRRASYGVPGCPNGKSEFASAMLARLGRRMDGNPRTPKWQGELYLEYHRGTYTSMAKNKRNNRKSEFLYQQTEMLCSMAGALTGLAYPKAVLHEGWEHILTNQFHDIIPGSSIKEVYDDSDKDYATLMEWAEKEKSAAVEALLSRIPAKGKYVIFNGNSFPGNGIVRVDGCAYYVQDIPAKGYCVLPLAPQKSRVTLSGRTVDTPFFTVEFDEHYNIARLYDKQNAREVLRAGECGNQLLVHEDFPYAHDNWEISAYHEDKKYLLNEVSSVETVDEGARFGLRITRPWAESHIEQTIWFYNDLPKIDFENHVSWHQHHQLLCAAFPIDVNTDHATFDIQFGRVERPTHSNTSWDAMRFETCGHKYADLSENGYGVSLLNDCKYGHDVHDGVMKLTLIKCGTYPNPEADIGEHTFTYSVYPHAGSLCGADTVRLAYDLNLPMEAYAGQAGDGSLPERYSLVSCDRANVVVDTVKEAEDSAAMIVRFYETENIRTNTTLTFGFRPTRVTVCDLMENEQSELTSDGNTVSLTVRPFEIVTLKVER